MTRKHKLVSGALALVTGAMVGCAGTVPTQAPAPADTGAAPHPGLVADLVDPAHAEASLTADELGQSQYTIQQTRAYGYRYRWFGARRCRWFWVPSRWGWPYVSYWRTGRWVLICRPRYIPWWWYGGPWGSFGAFNSPPRIIPAYPRAFFDRYPWWRDRDRYRGDDDGYGRGPGGPDDDDDGRGPDDDENGRGPDNGDENGRGPGGPGGDDNGENGMTPPDNGDDEGDEGGGGGGGARTPATGGNTQMPATGGTT